MRILLLLILVGCATPQYVDLTEEIESVLEDETIPKETRFQVARKLMDRQINEIRVVAKKKDKLESKLESNQWKINFVDTIIYSLIAVMIAGVIYFYLKLKTGFL